MYTAKWFFRKCHTGYRSQIFIIPALYIEVISLNMLEVRVEYTIHFLIWKMGLQITGLK